MKTPVTNRVNPLDEQLYRRLGAMPTKKNLAAYQLRQINYTLALAQEKSPFYRRLYALPSLRRQLFCDNRNYVQLRQVKDLAYLPFIDEEDIKRYGTEMVCVPQDDILRIISLQSSGTTRQPKRIFLSSEDIRHTVEFFFYGLQTMISAAGRVAVLFPCQRPNGVGDLLLQALDKLGVWAETGPVKGSLAQGAAQLSLQQPTMLIGAPIPILALGRYLAAQCLPAPPVSAILISSDFAAGGVVKALEKLWNCPVYQHYGLTESAYGAAVSCTAGQGQHIRESDLLLEIINPADNSVISDESPGEIVLTTLTRQAMPLIRYRSGDRGHRLNQPCACGSILQRLADGPQRYTSFISGKGMDLCLGMLDEALLPLKGVADLQFFLGENDCAALWVWVVEDISEGLIQEHLAPLKALSGLNIAITIKQLTNLPPLTKRKIIIMERNTADANN